jgi:hypothetical protein
MNKTIRGMSTLKVSRELVVSMIHAGADLDCRGLASRLMVLFQGSGMSAARLPAGQPGVTRAPNAPSLITGTA